MAPLRGLDRRNTASRWNRFGADLYRHGEHYSDFNELRRAKARFAPRWDPRFAMLTARALFSARAPGFGKIGGRQLPSKSCSKSCIAWFASFRLDFFRNSAEWDLSFIATGAACYGSVFEQEISQPKPEPRYGLNMSTFFI